MHKNEMQKIKMRLPDRSVDRCLDAVNRPTATLNINEPLITSRQVIRQTERGHSRSSGRQTLRSSTGMQTDGQSDRQRVGRTRRQRRACAGTTNIHSPIDRSIAQSFITKSTSLIHLIHHFSTHCDAMGLVFRVLSNRSLNRESLLFHSTELGLSGSGMFASPAGARQSRQRRQREKGRNATLHLLVMGDDVFDALGEIFFARLELRGPRLKRFYVALVLS
eukprot:Selendium_serpulae@DN5698_c0_g1_i2.p1